MLLRSITTLHPRVATAARTPISFLGGTRILSSLVDATNKTSPSQSRQNDSRQQQQQRQQNQQPKLQQDARRFASSRNASPAPDSSPVAPQLRALNRKTVNAGADATHPVHKPAQAQHRRRKIGSPFVKMSMRNQSAVDDEHADDNNDEPMNEDNAAVAAQAAQFNPFKPEAVFTPSKNIVGAAITVPAIITEKDSRHLAYLIATGSDSDWNNIADQCCAHGCADIAFTLSGSRLLRKLLEHGTAVVAAKIVANLQEDAVILSQDAHGRVVMETLFTHHQSEQIDKLVQKMVTDSPDVISDCCDQQYSYVMRSILSFGSAEARDFLGRTFVGHMTELSMDTYGHFPAQIALKSLASDLIAQLVEDLLGDSESFMEVAMSPSGCFVMQQLLEQIEQKDRLLAVEAMHGNVLELATAENGHFCLQTALRVFPQAERAILVDELLSTTKSIATCNDSEHGRFVLRTIMKTRAGSNPQKKLVRDAMSELSKPQIMVVNPSPPKKVEGRPKWKRTNKFMSRKDKSKKKSGGGITGWFKSMWGKITG